VIPYNALNSEFANFETPCIFFPGRQLRAQIQNPAMKCDLLIGYSISSNQQGGCISTIVERFPLPSVSPPMGDTSLTHVMKLAAHSTSPTPTALEQSFIIINNSVDHVFS
jgi:hypothetical protein